MFGSFDRINPAWGALAAWSAGLTRPGFLAAGLAALLLVATPLAAEPDEDADDDNADVIQEVPALQPATDRSDDEADADEPQFSEPRRDCIRVRLIRNFSTIDRYHAIFYESANRVYLVTFTSPCLNLRSAITIRAASRTGRICGFAGERIIVGRNVPERCFVRSVERVDNAEHARFLVAERTGQDEDDTDPDADADEAAASATETTGTVETEPTR